MEVAYLYTKVRSDFGKQVKFEDPETRILFSVPPTDELDKHHVPEAAPKSSVSERS